MTECGVVIKLIKNKAVVSFDRKAACDQCRMCAVSKTGKTVEITVANELNAIVGDRVEVTMGSKYVLTAAVIVYIIPLILVTAAVFIGQIWGETVQLILTFAALALGFCIAIMLDRLVIRKKKGFAPQMTRLIVLNDVEISHGQKEKLDDLPEDVPDEGNSDGGL